MPFRPRTDGVLLARWAPSAQRWSPVAGMSRFMGEVDGMMERSFGVWTRTGAWCSDAFTPFAGVGETDEFTR